MSESPKMEHDEAKEASVPSERQEVEPMAEQAPETPQTAPQAEKFGKLKQRFDALKKEYLILLQNWEESNQRVAQLTQERKFLRDKLQFFLRSSQFQGKVTDDDLALALLARSQTSNERGGVAHTSTLQVEQLLSLVQLAQQKQHSTSAQPNVKQSSSSKATKAALAAAAAAAANGNSVNGTATEFAKPQPPVTTVPAVAKNTNTITILQKQPTVPVSNPSSTVAFTASPSIQPQQTSSGQQLTINNNGKASEDAQVNGVNAGEDKAQNGPQRNSKEGQSRATVNGSHASPQILLSAGPGSSASLAGSTMTGQALHINAQAGVQSTDSSQPLTQQQMQEQIQEQLRQQTQAHISKSKQEQDFVHLNGSSLAGSAPSKRQKTSTSQDKPMTGASATATQVKIHLGNQTFRMDHLPSGGVLTSAQTASFFQAQQMQAQGHAPPVKKPRKRKEPLAEKMAKQMLAMSSDSPNAVKVIAQGRGIPVGKPAASTSTSITLHTVNAGLDKQKVTMSSAQSMQNSLQTTPGQAGPWQVPPANGAPSKGQLDQLTISQHPQQQPQQQQPQVVHLTQSVIPSTSHAQQPQNGSVDTYASQAALASNGASNGGSKADQQASLSLMDQLTMQAARHPQQPVGNQSQVRQQVSVNGSSQIMLNSNQFAPGAAPNGSKAGTGAMQTDSALYAGSNQNATQQHYYQATARSHYQQN